MLKDFCHEKESGKTVINLSFTHPDHNLGGQSPLHLPEEKVWSANNIGEGRTIVALARLVDLQKAITLLERRLREARRSSLFVKWDKKEISAQELILVEDELGVEDLLFLGSLYSGYELNLERMPPQGTEGDYNDMNPSSKIKTLRLISLGALWPFLLYPFIFCPYRWPYLYCSICYLRCSWGRLRGLLLLGILGLNLKKRFYCRSLCLGGMIQDLQSKVRVKRFILPSWSHYTRYPILALTIIFILAIRKYYIVFMVDKWVLVVLLIFLFSFFSHRFWCLLFCPIGALSEVVLRIWRRITGQRE